MKTLFLAGSDYVFPRTANKIIKQYAKELGIEIVGEEYVPLDSDDWTTQVAKIAAAKPDFVFNTINGSSNVGFIKAYDEAGLGADNSPIISVSIAEEEAPAMGVDLTGQYAAWNYFQSVDSPENATFIKAFQAKYGADRPTSDPMEAAYTSLYLYKNMVEKAESFCVDAVNAASDGVTFDAPEGTVTVNGENHHIAKTGLIGQINADNQFDIVWSSDGADRARSVPRGLQLVGPERRTEARVLTPARSSGVPCVQHGTPGRSADSYRPRHDDLKAERWTYSPPPSSRAPRPARSCCWPRSASRSRSARWA